MALLVPNIGELESLRYLVANNNHVPSLSDQSPETLFSKAFVSDTTPAEGDTPSATAYFEPYQPSVGGVSTNAYGYAPTTGYPYCVNNRTDLYHTLQTGILLNGSRWVINQVGSGTTATYPEQTFTFSGDAGDVYATTLLALTTCLPMYKVLYMLVGVGTTVTLGDNADPVIGVIGNSYITIDPNQSVDSITLGMIVGGNPGIQDGTKVIGVDRALKVIYLDKALVDNIQLETDADVTFALFGTVTIANHGLVAGDIVYIAAGTANTTTASGTYTVFNVPNNDQFTTTPALNPLENNLAGVGTATLYSSIMYAERFTNGPYTIQNNGDQIKITLNVALD